MKFLVTPLSGQYKSIFIEAPSRGKGCQCPEGAHASPVLSPSGPNCGGPRQGLVHTSHRGQAAALRGARSTAGRAEQSLRQPSERTELGANISDDFTSHITRNLLATLVEVQELAFASEE